MGSARQRTRPWPWALWILLVMGGVVALNVYASLHPATAIGAGAERLFHMICHQNPDRSFAIAGEPLCVCHRCFGIYAGLGIGALAVLLGLRVDPGRRLAWLVALAPMGLHVALLQVVPAVDLVPLRVGTGLLLGSWGGAALPCALGTVRLASSDDAWVPLERREEGT